MAHSTENTPLYSEPFTENAQTITDLLAKWFCCLAFYCQETEEGEAETTSQETAASLSSDTLWIWNQGPEGHYGRYAYRDYPEEQASAYLSSFESPHTPW
jgi:hypothetical protein